MTISSPPRQDGQEDGGRGGRWMGCRRWYVFFDRKLRMLTGGEGGGRERAWKTWNRPRRRRGFVRKKRYGLTLANRPCHLSFQRHCHWPIQWPRKFANWRVHCACHRPSTPCHWYWSAIGNKNSNKTKSAQTINYVPSVSVRLLPWLR